MATTNEMNKHQIASYIDSALHELFPNNRAEAIVRNILGEVIVVTYTKGRGAHEYANGIIQNDPAFFRVLIQSNHAGTGPFHIDGSRIGPVKFRKISANTEHEAAEKLVKWFRKNADAIKAI